MARDCVRGRANLECVLIAMNRPSHANPPPLRLLERRAPRAVPARPAPVAPTPAERLQAWLRRLVPSF